MPLNFISLRIAFSYSFEKYISKIVYSRPNNSRSAWFKKKLFAMKQEGCRKNVERAFGVLQSRFAIVAGQSHMWNKNGIT